MCRFLLKNVTIFFLYPISRLNWTIINMCRLSFFFLPRQLNSCAYFFYCSWIINFKIHRNESNHRTIWYVWCIIGFWMNGWCVKHCWRDRRWQHSSKNASFTFHSIFNFFFHKRRNFHCYQHHIACVFIHIHSLWDIFSFTLSLF